MTGALGVLVALLVLTSTAFQRDAFAAPSADRTPALELEIQDAIGPATALYIQHGLAVAQQRGSPFVILEIDTPGGLATSMRTIISDILASSVPVVAYVAPSGARAASAGTYILYACHFAVMAPATNLGAATPVSIGGSEPAPPATAPVKQGKAAAGSEQTPTMSAEEQKVLNDSIAYIRGLAQLRGRNADWAEQAVRGAASLPANQALQQHVIDFIAPDVSSLLTQLNGRETHIGSRTVRLDTRGVRIEWLKPDWRMKLLAVITNPEIAYGLLLIGIWGLLFEGYHPGGVLPGVVGVISLLVALFAFQLLPTNFAGLALLIIGAGMMGAEFFFPTYGSLGIGGLIAFIVGSLILFSGAPGIEVALPLIGGLATVGGLVILGIVYLAIRARRTPVVTGTQAMLGAVVEAVADFAAQGRVRYGGEMWNACSLVPLKAGQAARVVKVEGLTLWVEPLR
ncbi:MAG TPA: nodulation protein NfeD [Steroidobacteraceae bacterium]|jgi:membrane-bound serine protease (ClpP class)